jgi:hypothetical protein
MRSRARQLDDAGVFYLKRDIQISTIDLRSRYAQLLSQVTLNLAYNQHARSPRHFYSSKNTTLSSTGLLAIFNVFALKFSSSKPIATPHKISNSSPIPNSLLKTSG